MSYRVYEFREVDRERLEAELSADPLWKLGYTERHARFFGLDRETFFVVLEGPAPALVEADRLLLRFGRRPPQDEALLLRFRAADTLAATSLGKVLGPVREAWHERPRKPPGRIELLRRQWEEAPKPWGPRTPWWKVWAWRWPGKRQSPGRGG